MEVDYGAVLLVGKGEEVGTAVVVQIKLPAVPTQLSSAPPLSPPTLHDTSLSFLPSLVVLHFFYSTRFNYEKRG